MADGVLDLEALLAPIGEGDGAGEDLRADWSPGSPYQRLRDARSEARTEERARDAEGDDEAPPPEGWREVRRVGVQALAERSKDFEIAAWLAEAMVRLEGLPGLSASARLIAGLCERYWDAGFPQPDDEGHEGRASPIGGLAGAGGEGTLMQPLRRLALFQRTDGTPVGLWKYEQAVETAGIADEARRQARLDAGVPLLDTLEAEARMDAARLRSIGAQAAEAAAAWAEMDAALTARFGADAPSTRRVAELLARMREIAQRTLGADSAAPDADQEQPAATAAEPAPGAAAGAAPAAARRATGAIETREDALRLLSQVADFFRRTEPHSPLAYTLDDAVRRGRMSLPELLAEVLPDETARTTMLSSLGIRPPSPE
jgi:type VI secretion system protein ImpA